MRNEEKKEISALHELFPIPNIEESRRLLCIQPHPDDTDIACGATIARLADRGIEVIYLTITDDAAGFTTHKFSLKQRKRIRKEEQIAAGTWLGVKSYWWLDYPDAGNWSRFKARNKIIGILRKVRPDFILTVDPWLPYEAHRDHVKSGSAACEAAILCDLPCVAKFDPEQDTASVSIRGIGFFFTSRPNVFFDGSAYKERKQKAIAEHASQFDKESLQGLYQYDEIRAKLLGKSNGYAYAEGLKVVNPRMLHAFTEIPDREIARLKPLGFVGLY
ncbi:MAG: PIG-L deacetylase family protein [Spirochaetota bacterium]